MAGYEVGSAFLTVMPSAKGFTGNLSREIDGPLDQAGQRGGQRLGDGVGKGGKSSFVSAGKGLGVAFAGAFAAVGLGTAVAAIGDYLSGAVGAASDLSETMNKSKVIFGEYAEDIEWIGTNAAKNFGLSKEAAIGAAAGFGNMFQQIGFARGESVTMSVAVLKLAADLGSFNNLETDDVMDRISAALRGEYDSLQALIPTINAARVEQEALAATGKTVTTELTAQEKAAAVLAIVTKDGAAALDDFKNTSDGLANSQKILQADLENVKTEIGTALLPVVTDLVKMFRDEGVPVLQQFAEWVTKNKDDIQTFALVTVDATLLVAQAFLGLIEHMSRMGDFWLTISTNMMQTWLNVVEGVINAAAQMFGWVPGVGPKLREVQDGFSKVRDVADQKFGEARAAADALTGAMQDGQKAVQGLRDGIKSIDGMTANVRIVADASGIAQTENGGRILGRAGFRAGGGPVEAGRPYIVGEREAELFVPDRPGMIYNQSQMAAMGVGGSKTSNLTVNNYERALSSNDLVMAQRTIDVLNPEW